MNIHLASSNVCENAFVNSGFAPNIVMFRQTINGHANDDTRNPHPFFWYGNDRTCDQQSENVHLAERREDAIQFSAPHERFSANQRDVTRPMFPHQSQNAFDQRIPPQITQLSQSDFTSQVGIAIGVTAWTPQRTLSSDFDGKYRNSAAQSLPPCSRYSLHRLDV
jgi:hypothetical protein